MTAFCAGRFDDCLDAFTALANEAGPTKLEELYRRAIENLRDENREQEFEGVLRLTTK